MPSTDVTPLFRAIAKMKTAKMGAEISPSPTRATALELSPAFAHYSRSLKETARELSALTNVVLTQRADYLSFNSPLPRMTDAQRDAFDADSEKALRQLQSILGSLKKQIDEMPVDNSSMTSTGDNGVKKIPQGEQSRSHLSYAARALSQRLKQLADIVAKMRTLRIRHEARRRKLLRLSSLVELAKESEARRAKESGGLSPVASFSSLLSLDSINTHLRRRHRGLDGQTTHNEHGNGRAMSEERTRERSGSPANDDAREPTKKREAEKKESKRAKWSEEEEQQLPLLFPGEKTRDRASARESMQSEENSKEATEKSEISIPANMEAQLVAENEEIYDNLANINKEMDHVEQQVAEIQRLQETFAEKVLEQERDIDILQEQAVNTTENLREGNEWIREAITNSASRRVVVLFCIIVLTFAILFIDWYNP